MRAMTLILILLVAGWCDAHAAEWEADFIEVPALEANATLGYSGRPAVGAADGRIHLVFQNNLDLDLFRIGYVSRDPDGQWGTPEVISQVERSALNPTSALDRDGQLHVLWEDVTSADPQIVHCMRRVDGTWAEPVAVAPAPGFSSQPRVVVDAFNRLHAVWVDNRTGYRAVLHSTAEVGGSWGPPLVLTTEEDIPDDVVLAADGLGGVHAVWRAQEGSPRTGIFFQIAYVRLEAGMTEAPKPTVLVPHPSISYQPYIEATEDGTLHLVWMDNRTALGGAYFEIFYKRYLPGVGWGHDKRFTYEDTEHSRPVAVAGSDGTVNIAWEDYREGNPRIFYRQITEETGWDPIPTQISTGPGSSQTPTLITFPDDRVVLLWTEALASGDTRILAKEGLLQAAP